MFYGGLLSVALSSKLDRSPDLKSGACGRVPSALFKSRLASSEIENGVIALRIHQRQNFYSFTASKIIKLLVEYCFKQI